MTHLSYLEWKYLDCKRPNTIWYKYIFVSHILGGTILQHHIPPNGNWMNIRFQTKLQAQKALGRTGRVFGGSLMVGVSPCLDPPADATANASQILDHTSHQDTSVMSLNSRYGA